MIAAKNIFNNLKLNNHMGKRFSVHCNCYSKIFDHSVKHKNVHKRISLKNATRNLHIYNTVLEIKYTESRTVKYSTSAAKNQEDSFKEQDTFGLLGGRKYENVELDADEYKEDEFEKNISRVPRKFKPTDGEYAEMIKNYINKGDLIEARNVLLLIKKNGDRPNSYHFSLLINAFANQGAVKQCFDFYRTMTKRKLKIKENIYTSLFNSIATCPCDKTAEFYLENKLIKYVEKNKVVLNHAHYNVMVKAYGRLNKIDEAYKLADVMRAKNMKIGISTINSLMYTGINDRESGLKHVIKTWQLMQKLTIPPDLSTFNLLLRGIRDTSFGKCTVQDLLCDKSDQELIQIDDNRSDLLNYPPVMSLLTVNQVKKDIQLLEDASSKSRKKKLTTQDNKNKALISLPSTVYEVDLSTILKHNKLILFGGFTGFIKRMENSNIAPDVKTLTYMISLVPDSITAEDMVIKFAKNNKIKLDIAFFNVLLKKRITRHQKLEAKELLVEIHKHDLKPDIMTYGILALACETPNEGRELINTLKSTGLGLNKYIAQSLLINAFNRINFGYILEIMEMLKKDRVKLDEETFVKLDEFQGKMRELVKTKHHYASTDFFKNSFKKFSLRYKKWQQEMGRKVITRVADTQDSEDDI